MLLWTKDLETCSRIENSTFVSKRGLGKRSFRCRIQSLMGEGADEDLGSCNRGVGYKRIPRFREAAVGETTGDRGSAGTSWLKSPALPLPAPGSPREAGREGPAGWPTRLHPSPRPRTYRGTRSGRCSGPERLGLRRYWSCPATSYPGCLVATSSRWGPLPAAAAPPSPPPARYPHLNP